MGSRGVDLAQVKAQRVRESQLAAEQILLAWARAWMEWLEAPIGDEETDERTMRVASTGQTLVVSRRLAGSEECDG